MKPRDSIPQTIAIPVPWNSQQITRIVSPLTQSLTNCRYLNSEVRLFHDLIWPDATKQLVFSYQASCVLNQHDQHVKSLRR